MIPVLLAFCSSAFWGSSDFVAGLGARRVGALRTSLIVYLGATSVTVSALGLRPGEFSSAGVLSGAVAAAVSAVGFVSFYMALALAPMGAVTAVVAATEVVLPVVVGVMLQDELISGLGWIGILTATGGAVLVGLAEGGRDRSSSRAIYLAVLAGTGFGLAVVALEAAPHESGLVAPAVEMGGGLLLTLSFVAFARFSRTASRFAIGIGIESREPLERKTWILGFAAGAIQGLANLLLMFALWSGHLAVVGVIVCLYPITTALLARVVLQERLSKRHWAGIALALVGCVFLAFA